MLQISCPFCGPRNEVEFVYGGPLKNRRPDDISQIDDTTWIDYLTVPKKPTWTGARTLVACSRLRLLAYYYT